MNENPLSTPLPHPAVLPAAQRQWAGVAVFSQPKPAGHQAAAAQVQPVSVLQAVAHAPHVSLVPASAWYVCLTKPRQEAYAVGKLREQGYEVYLPLLDSWARRAGQWCKKQSVMFPRYAFVRPARPDQSVSPVRSTPGVTTLVKFGPVLACLPADKLCLLQSLLARRAAALPGKPLAVGQEVVFASGPFKGMAGIVSSVADERVSVLMTLLGQQQNLQTPINDLAAA